MSEGVRIATSTIVDLCLKAAIGIAVGVASFFARGISQDVNELQSAKGDMQTKLAVIEASGKYWIERVDRIEGKIGSIEAKLDRLVEERRK